MNALESKLHLKTCNRVSNIHRKRVAMGKVCNMVKVVKFRNADDLYSILDELMNTDEELSGDRRCYRVQDLKLIDEKYALVYLEEDFNIV